MTNEERARALLTPEALALVTELARRYGWSGDYFEIAQFVEWCYQTAGQPAPDLEPYPSE